MKIKIKPLSSKQIAFFTALGSSLIVWILLIFDFEFTGFEKIMYILFSLLSNFIIIYLAIFYILNNIIIKHIRPIYKTIYEVKISDNELYNDIENSEVFSQLNEEVRIWASRKTEEINLLKANEKYRKEFLGNVMHELKTPIFNIQGYVLTLIDGGWEDKEIFQKFLQRSEKNINRLISIVKDLEAISQLESGQLKLQFSRFNLVKAIEDVFEMQEIKATQYGVKLVFSHSFNDKIMVYADKLHIIEVIGNLINNSIKYGKQGGITVISLSETKTKILVTVKDDGIGIAKEHLPRIFERFYRVDKSRSRKRGGTGLGLAIVKHIIEAHHETIKVDSEIDRGTAFIFSLQKSMQSDLMG